MKVTGKRIALSTTCLGIIVIVLAAIVSRGWIMERLSFLRAEEPWVKKIRTILDQQMLSCSFSQRPLNQVMSFLSEQTGVKIVIDPAVLSQDRRITLKAKDMKAGEVLDQVLVQTALTYDSGRTPSTSRKRARDGEVRYPSRRWGSRRA